VQSKNKIIFRVYRKLTQRMNMNATIFGYFTVFLGYEHRPDMQIRVLLDKILGILQNMQH